MTEPTGVTFASPAWSERCLTLARGAALTAVAAVPFSTALTSIAYVIVVASWAVSGRVPATLNASLRHPFGLALLVFLVIAAAGMFYSSVAWPDRLDALSGWRRLGYAVILLGLFADGDWQRRFVSVFLVAASAGLFLSCLAWAGVIPSKPGHPAGVLLQNHATQGMVFALAILCSVFRAKEASRKARRVLLGLAILFALNVVFVTPGRSGYVALFVAVLACGPMYLGWRRILIWLPVTLVLASLAFVASPTVRDRVMLGLDEIRAVDDSPALTSMGIRAVLYTTTLELIRERPVAGHGTGSFGKEYSAVVAQRYTDWRATPSKDPHNQYLFVAMELGIVGLAAFVAMLAAAFFAARETPYGWIAAGALAIWSVTSLFSSHFRTFPEGHLIGLFLGVLLARAPKVPAASGAA